MTAQSTNSLGQRASKCGLWFGTTDEDICAALAGQLNKHCPPLLWREPQNGPRTLDGFRALTRAAADTAGNRWPLSEARLFYPGGLLHLLAAGSQTRWAAWLELGGTAADLTRPHWLTFNGQGDPTSVRLDVQRRKICLRKGGHSGQAVATVKEDVLQVVEYYDRGTLRWWRIDTDE